MFSYTDICIDGVSMDEKCKSQHPSKNFLSGFGLLNEMTSPYKQQFII